MLHPYLLRRSKKLFERAMREDPSDPELAETVFTRLQPFLADPALLTAAVAAAVVMFNRNQLECLKRLTAHGASFSGAQASYLHLTLELLVHPRAREAKNLAISLIELMELLLANGADINATSGQDQRTALHQAVDSCRRTAFSDNSKEIEKIVAFLCARGACATQLDAGGFTARELLKHKSGQWSNQVWDGIDKLLEAAETQGAGPVFATVAATAMPPYFPPATTLAAYTVPPAQAAGVHAGTASISLLVNRPWSQAGVQSQAISMTPAATTQHGPVESWQCVRTTSVTPPTLAAAQASVAAAPQAASKSAPSATAQMPAARMSPALSRICNVGVELGECINPISGVRNGPLMSLQDAVAVCADIVPRVVQYAVYVCAQRLPLPGGMTHDEGAAIRLYTMQWGDEKDSLFYPLNAALRDANRNAIKPFFPYLTLLLSALDRLPKREGTLFRGVRKDLKSLTDRHNQMLYVKDHLVPWWGFSSCTTNLEVLQSNQFLGQAGCRIMFCIEGCTGVDLKLFSACPQEDEILMLPGTMLRVSSVVAPAPDMWMVHLSAVPMIVFD
eukprot:TRINITY_DN13427_c0_g1_i1.p1 TRINITY_DN13427_c0_g1~~TRINITY_DN13427_c0_g1_i1.p1  ORF type:complete len:562 (+),score=73.43 TRINITY_DN13427_c0_g1_i1:1651-3336(+)